MKSPTQHNPPRPWVVGVPQACDNTKAKLSSCQVDKVVFYWQQSPPARYSATQYACASKEVEGFEGHTQELRSRTLHVMHTPSSVACTPFHLPQSFDRRFYKRPTSFVHLLPCTPPPYWGICLQYPAVPSRALCPRLRSAGTTRAILASGTWAAHPTRPPLPLMASTPP